MPTTNDLVVTIKADTRQATKDLKALRKHAIAAGLVSPYFVVVGMVVGLVLGVLIGLGVTV